MEELKNKKHNHVLTKLLKFSIFALVMLAPFISVASKSIYVAFNKNAKESYYGETINETQNVYLETTTPSTNTKFYLNINDLAKSDMTGYIDIYNFNVYDRLSLSQQQYDDLITYKNSIMRLIFADRGNYASVRIMRLDNNSYIQVRDLYPYSESDICILEFNISYVENSDVIQYVYSIEHNKYSYLDNSFQYAVNQLEQDNLYNWSKNTGIYTAIQTMTSGLGINNVVAMLLAYWSMITCVYIVFDIIIELFIRITHMINAE